MNKLTKAIKLYWFRLNLKWIERDIAAVEAWLLGVTTKDKTYVIVDAKCELADLRTQRTRMKGKISNLEK